MRFEPVIFRTCHRNVFPEFPDVSMPCGFQATSRCSSSNATRISGFMGEEDVALFCPGKSRFQTHFMEHECPLFRLLIQNLRCGLPCPVSGIFVNSDEGGSWSGLARLQSRCKFEAVRRNYTVIVICRGDHCRWIIGSGGNVVVGRIAC